MEIKDLKLTKQELNKIKKVKADVLKYKESVKESLYYVLLANEIMYASKKPLQMKDVLELRNKIFEDKNI